MDNTLIVVLLAALGPMIGSAIGVAGEPKMWFMFNMLSFAAGVMLSISFLSLLPEALHISSVPIATAGLVLGALVMYALDRIIPHIHPELCTQEQGANIKKTSA